MIDGTKLVVRRTFNAPIEKVFAAWVNDDEMKQWKSPEGMTTPVLEAEAVVGGKYHIQMRNDIATEGHPAGSFDVRGEYKEIDPNKKLVFSWKWDGDQRDATLVTVEFSKITDSKTEVVLTHTGFGDAKVAAEHDLGWESTFNNLRKFLAK